MPSPRAECLRFQDKCLRSMGYKGSLELDAQRSLKIELRKRAPAWLRASSAPPSAARRAPAAEDEAADGEAETERTERKRTDGDELPPQREPLPAADRLLFLRREWLTAPLLAGCAPRTQAQVDVVEQLRRLVRHGASVPPPSAVPATPAGSPTGRR